MAAFRRPESVLVVVHAGRRVLLLRRRAPFEFWQSVTGSLEPGESPADTARREIVEETGLAPDDRLEATGLSREFIIDPRWRDRYEPGVTRNVEYEFRWALDEPADIRLDGDEHGEYRWVDVDDAIDLVWSTTNRDALVALRAGL